MFFKTFTVLLLVAVSIISFASSTLVDECGDGIQKPIHVVIEGCQQPPCRLKRGSEAIMSMNFTAPKGEPIEELEAKVEIKYLDVESTFVFSEPNGCNGLINTHCPLEENEPAVYKQKVSIVTRNAKGPAEYFTATFRMLYNKNDKALVCFKVMCIID